MAKVTWNGAVIAESDSYEVVENNVYFPIETVNRDFLKPSNHITHCPWKGDANYYTLVVNGEENENAAWYYATPKAEAAHIKNHVAFWKGVEVIQP